MAVDRETIDKMDKIHRADKIDRKKLVSSHNPVLLTIDKESPLTVGNGELGFTADVTGMQSLYEEYRDTLPLCTLSQWGWHTQPVSETQDVYTLQDLVMTEYSCGAKTVRYPQRKMPGNGDVYDWLRKNPHRLNLARIGFLCQGAELKQEQILDVHQELHLYEGILESRFTVSGSMARRCEGKSVCHHEKDVLGFSFQSEAFQAGELSVRIAFPYGSPDITASDWENSEKHQTVHVRCSVSDSTKKRTKWIFKRILDADTYFMALSVESDASVSQNGHEIVIIPQEKNLIFTVAFGKTEESVAEIPDFKETEKSSIEGWNTFWEKGGIIRLNHSKDKRAWELERRIILSQYLMALNSVGSLPPQETGLTCNSWYGKMHLEMYLWHCAWLALWQHTELLEKSFSWYLTHLQEARDNAARNGYRGARWPKMIGPQGIDCPSPIAPLLIWQQPHIIYMLELAYQDYRQRGKAQGFREKYWKLIEETADFMVDFVQHRQETDCYDLPAPVIPVQECHRAEYVENPAFELEYWTFTLKIACEWARDLGLESEKTSQWQKVGSHMAPMAEKNGLYLAHKNCPDTFEKYNKDHPSMLGGFGLIDSKRTDREKMRATLHKVLECWEYKSLWGWDFALMAMTAVRLGEPETAVDILLKDTMKNSYVTSGNNMQKSRKDLPLYLPGNGALLLAVPLMAAGYAGCEKETPGFPDNGEWTVEFENIEPYPV